MKLPLKTIWEMLKETAERWSDNNAPRLAASVAYYTIFSVAPLLVIAIAVAGLFFGDDAVQGRIVEEIQGLVGRGSAEIIQTMISNVRDTGSSITATVIGIGTLLVGSTGVFVELQNSLNTVWDVAPRPGRGILGVLRDRLLSFAVVVSIGFVLLVSLVVSAGVTAVTEYLTEFLPEAISGALLQTSTTTVSFLVTTLLFAMLFKLLPDVRITWSEVWIGAIITSFLFTLGKFLIGLYLGRSSLASTYGAAGSLVIFLVWIYYSGLILFFGAEFTQVYAKRRGRPILPTRNAVRVDRRLLTENAVADSESSAQSAESTHVKKDAAGGSENEKRHS